MNAIVPVVRHGVALPSLIREKQHAMRQCRIARGISDGTALVPGCQLTVASSQLTGNAAVGCPWCVERACPPMTYLVNWQLLTGNCLAHAVPLQLSTCNF